MYKRLLTIFVSILLMSCSHFEESKQNKRLNTVLNQFSNQKIAVVAPANSCNQECIKILNTFKEYHSNITFNIQANTDEEKAIALKKALLNEENDIIWIFRGGYGTANVVELLYNDEEFLKQMKRKKKIPHVIGYCDVTALHLFLSQEFGWKTIHGAMMKEILNENKSIGNFCALNGIVNGIHKLEFVGLKPLNSAARNSKEISGKITGGNLSIIQTSIGTTWQIKTKNKILFLEDWKEKPYKIARMLYHMKMSGLFNEVKAIVIGYMDHKNERIKQCINDFSKNISIPVYTMNVFGHGIYNYPIIYNSDGIITVKNNTIKLNINFECEK